ncbi:MAG TPA: MFS transporter [Sphingomonadaceae bacterium]|nr:MFS transporter [Sphingomonadaceae bacterium]
MSDVGRTGVAAEPGIVAPRATDERYAWYVLSVLVLVYMLNFIDRQILSILAEDIKRDLNLTDADLGFLYGTAFGVFYALFGIPLGRLADNWNRVKLMTSGLALWSLMTAVSGFAKNGAMLAGARIGVGIGEATASPCAYSLLSDYFPREKRATALAIYSSGLFIGGGLSLFIGGAVVQNWNAAFPNPALAPLGLRGWQAAFMAVGLPGLLLAVWVATLREPIRGQSDGLVMTPSARPFADFFAELLTIIPPLTLIGAARRGGGALAINLLVGGASAAAALLLIRLTGDIPQWTAVGIGVYAVFSWAASLRRRDPPTFALIIGTPAFLLTVLGYGLIAFNAYAVSFWSAPYALRELGASPATAGLLIGGSGAVGGFLGVVIGGRVADQLRRNNPSGRVLVVLAGAILPLIPLVIAFTSEDLTVFYALQIPLNALSSCALGAAAATTQDLVLPRMRGAATATFFIGTTLIGLALGPYIAGRVSLATGDLATGILSLLAAAPISIVAILVLYRMLPAAEASVVERARAAGEPI